MQDLTAYQAIVYIQDEYSDRVYCSLANRFYEALAAGMAVFIDARSINTFQKSGLQGWEPWVVHSAEDVAKLLPQAEEIAFTQRTLWHADYVQLLRDRLHEVAL